MVPFGNAARIREGDRLTVVSWGAMIHRCVKAAGLLGDGVVDLLDLRTISPWDREMVLSSVARTSRCLVVHEDTATAGFGAEVAATVARDGFWFLDAPVDRIAVEDVPMPYHPTLLASVLPSVEEIASRMEALLKV
jgi:2-oxoisovalerate dehydrogenase E1 component